LNGGDDSSLEIRRGSPSLVGPQWVAADKHGITKMKNDAD
jgi:hypothetical protein